MQGAPQTTPRHGGGGASTICPLSYEQSVLTWCTCVILLCLGPTPTEPGGWLAESSALGTSKE